MRLKATDAFDIRSIGSDANQESSMMEDRDESDCRSVGGDSVDNPNAGMTTLNQELSPGTTSGSSPGEILPKNLAANHNQSPPTANSAIASVQAALAALQAGQMSLNQVTLLPLTDTIQYST